MWATEPSGRRKWRRVASAWTFATWAKRGSPVSAAAQNSSDRFIMQSMMA